MPFHLLKTTLTVCALGMAYYAPAQSFYVTVPINYPVGMKVFKLNIGTCDSELQQSCRPTVNISQYPENQYLDMAADPYGNAYYVTGGGNLYEGRLNDSSSCIHLGNMVSGGGGVNSLAVDSQGFLYAAGWINNATRLILFKPATGARDLGSFPTGIASTGDLFFFEHRLFLTAGDIGKPKSLVEVSLPDPSGSCVYMSLGTTDDTYGAFSIRTGNRSRAFLVSVNKQNQTVLSEIDIPNKKVLPPLCTYPFVVTGAAAAYDLTADSTSCAAPLSVGNAAETDKYFMVVNPVGRALQMETNIPAKAIVSLSLYDMSGRLIKDLSADRDMSAIGNGIYLVVLHTTGGDRLVRRVVRE